MTIFVVVLRSSKKYIAAYKDYDDIPIRYMPLVWGNYDILEEELK